MLDLIQGENNIMYILSSEKTCRGPNKIEFSAHPQTSSCHRETGFDSREVQGDAQNRCVLSLDRLYEQIAVVHCLICNMYV